MYTFFILIFIGVINISLYEARPKINANLRNELYNSNYRPIDSLQTLRVHTNPNQGYVIVDENQDVNIGNGHNRHNAVIVDERSRPRFDENTNMDGIYGINSGKPNIQGYGSTLDNRYGTDETPQFYNPKPGQYSPNYRRTTDKNTIGIGNDNIANSNHGYTIADGNQILNFGNGRDNNNVLIVNKGSRRNFVGSNDDINNPATSNIHINNPDSKQIYTPNFRQTSTINSIGNGINNRNIVMINDNAYEFNRSPTTLHKHIQHSAGKPKLDSSMYTHYSKNLPLSDTGITLKNQDANEGMNVFDNIGHGPGNNNIVIVNSKPVYSNSMTTPTNLMNVPRQGEPFVNNLNNQNKTMYYNNNEKHEDFKVLPLKRV
ncbi:unnamed protein product, partial [Brenthis ino]